MPYVPHVRLTFGGSLGTGTPRESWAGTLAIGGDGTDPMLTNLSDSELAGVAAALTAWVNRADTSMATWCTHAWTKAALIKADGRYAADPRLRTESAPLAGTVSTNTHPFQVSRVISFETALKTPSGRGRLYSPAPAAAVQADGMVAAANALGAANSAATLLNAINQAITGANRVVVASSKGYNSAVLSVRVGRVLDTVRSRRTALLENYERSATAIINTA